MAEPKGTPRMQTSVVGTKATLDGTRVWLPNVQPRPLALCRVEVKAQSRTLLLQQTPDLEQDRHGRNDASVIHVPFLVHRSKTRDLTDKLVQSKQKYTGLKGSPC